MTIRILIADDHAVVAEGLRSLIGAQRDMEVVGLAGDGREAVRQALDMKPDVVVMDNAMPELNGIEATRAIRESCPGSRVVMLTMHSTSVHVQRALQAGADGYVMKRSVGRELVEAIRTVHAGRRYLSQPVDMGVSDAEESAIQSLAPQELRVLDLVAKGRTNKQIAITLDLSGKTVKNYLSTIFRKLGVSRRAEAAVIYQRSTLGQIPR